MNHRLLMASGVACLAGIGAAVALSACQSSQAKNDGLEARGETVLKDEKGLQISKTSSIVEVLDTAVLSDANGAAVVVTLKNTSSQALVNVPVAIDVQDAKGKTVFKNDDPGLVPSLTAVPQMLPGQTVDWVNDQILASGKPDSVKVKVGVTQSTLPPNPPRIEVSSPEVKNDPVSGLQAEGDVTNDSDVNQNNLVLFGVARQGNQIVAAGRGGIKIIKPGGERPYHIYFIGDPKGADVTVTAPPTNLY